MRTAQRLKGLQTWVRKEICAGRQMKAPAPNMDIGQIVRQEPQCYLAWAPARMDQTGNIREYADAVCPGIIIMPNQSYVKYTEEKRFDRYNNVHRPQELGQHLRVSILFSVYEPGTRLKGFIDSVGENGKGLDMSLIREGTEEGLFTLLNWMDDLKERLLGVHSIPGTDLTVDEESMAYSLYTDQKYVVDRRPIYYGFIDADFSGYAQGSANKTINKILS